MGMKVKLWGVRGSLPSPHLPERLEEKVTELLRLFGEHIQKTGERSPEDFLKTLPPYKYLGWGGNTACIQVSTPQHMIIIDGGSGIRRLGEQLALGPCGMGKGELDIFMTHFHWDHLIGLPFFIPVFVRGNKINIYSVQEDAEKSFRLLFQKPNFPVAYEHLGAQFVFHTLTPRVARVFKDMTITPYQLDHPDPCWGYRIESGGKVFAYCVDTEGTRVSRKDLGLDLPLYQGVDTMVFDAQYTFLEAAERVDWGHSSAPIGIDIAMREGIKRVFFVHHDPSAHDEKIASAEAQTLDYYEARVKSAQAQGRPVAQVQWEFAREGTVIDI
jgi:phosphoribosyl 1,2-cyclic phosphodiesterase